MRVNLHVFRPFILSVCFNVIYIIPLSANVPASYAAIIPMIFDFETICEWLGIKTEDEIESEIVEKQAEISELMDDFESEVDEDESEDDKRDYFNKYYKDDIDDLYAEIEELQEELSRWK